MSDDIVERTFPNVDKWGALEWFNRLADAVNRRGDAVISGDNVAFETYNNIASSSATRLACDCAAELLAALEAATELQSLRERVKELTKERDEARAKAIEECAAAFDTEAQIERAVLAYHNSWRSPPYTTKVKASWPKDEWIEQYTRMRAAIRSLLRPLPAPGTKDA